MSMTIHKERSVHAFQEGEPELEEEASSKVRRNSLMTYIQRRFLGSAKGFSSGLRRFNVGSCPNIPHTMDKAEDDKRVKERLPLRNSQSNDPNTLHVPNFFVTSQTHSEDWKIQCSSSPDLGNKPNRPVLRKAVSVTSPFETIKRDSRYFYRDSHLAQVLDFLFLGDIYSAYNPHVLCRLGIKRIVDISDTRPQEVPAHMKSLCSCPCRPDVKHSRPKLYIDVERNDTNDIASYFHEINRFLETARTAKANVLVHSYDGTNRGPCVVIQYLMAHYNMDLRTACRWVHKHRSSTKLNRECVRALEAWEIRCVPCVESNALQDSTYDRKCAWSDC